MSDLAATPVNSSSAPMSAYDQSRGGALVDFPRGPRKDKSKRRSRVAKLLRNRKATVTTKTLTDGAPVHLDAARWDAEEVQRPPLRPSFVLEIPDIRQADDFSCGAATAMSVSRAFGLGPLDLDEWKRAVGTNNDTEENSGTAPEAIVAYLAGLGLETTARQNMSIEDLAAAVNVRKHPVIVAIQEYGTAAEEARDDSGHYVAVLAVPLGYVIVQDPSLDNAMFGQDGDQAGGKMLIRDERFLAVWHDRGAGNVRYVRYGIEVGPGKTGHAPWMAPSLASNAEKPTPPTPLVTALQALVSHWHDHARLQTSLGGKVNLQSLVAHGVRSLVPHLAPYHERGIRKLQQHATEKGLRAHGLTLTAGDVVTRKDSWLSRLGDSLHRLADTIVSSVVSTFQDKANAATEAHAEESRSGTTRPMDVPDRLADIFSADKARAIAEDAAHSAEQAGYLDAAHDRGGPLRMRWVAQAGACDFCSDLDGAEVNLGEPFADAGGAWGPVYHPISHPHCRCNLELVPAEEPAEMTLASATTTRPTLSLKTLWRGFLTRKAGGHDVSGEDRDESGEWTAGGASARVDKMKEKIQQAAKDKQQASKVAKDKPATSIPAVDFNGTSPAEFRHALSKSTRSENHTQHTDEELKDSRLFLSADGNVGFLLTKDGDFANLFNNGKTKGAGQAAIIKGIEEGAQTLDCYDDYLPTLYSWFGFVAVARLKFNDAYAPPGWDYEKLGRPDVVFMTYKGGDRATIKDRVKTFTGYVPGVAPEVDSFDAGKRLSRGQGVPA